MLDTESAPFPQMSLEEIAPASLPTPVAFIDLGPTDPRNEPDNHFGVTDLELQRLADDGCRIFFD